MMEQTQDSTAIDSIFNLPMDSVVTTNNRFGQRTRTKDMPSVDDITVPQDKEYAVPDGIIATDAFKLAYEKIVQTRDHFFVTGSAGTGKSTFIRFLLMNLENEHRQHVVLTPTGIASATLMSNGVKSQTLHSFFKTGKDFLLPHQLKYENIAHIAGLVHSVDIFIIDEVSMVSSPILESINRMCQMIMSTDEPFGGKQFVYVGDLFQLPPVIADTAYEQYIEHTFGTPYFFSAYPYVRQETSLHIINFKQIHRQADKNFVDFLNHIKYDSINRSELDVYNRKFLSNQVPESSIRLCTTNKSAESYNRTQLEKLDSDWIELKGTVTGNFNFNTCPVDEIITVRVGARVMARMNDRDDDSGRGRRYVNGSLGTLIGYNSEKNSLLIKFDDYPDPIHISRVEFSNTKYVVKNNELDTEIIGSMKQYPISIAYAITVHKSQSLTLSHYYLDMGIRGAFASGQAYVALSRATGADSVQLIRPLTITDVMTDYRVKDFMKKNCPDYAETEVYSDDSNKDDNGRD